MKFISCRWNAWVFFIFIIAHMLLSNKLDKLVLANVASFPCTADGTDIESLRQGLSGIENRLIAVESKTELFGNISDTLIHIGQTQQWHIALVIAVIIGVFGLPLAIVGLRFINSYIRQRVDNLIEEKVDAIVKESANPLYNTFRLEWDGRMQTLGDKWDHKFAELHRTAVLAGRKGRGHDK